MYVKDYGRLSAVSTVSAHSTTSLPTSLPSNSQYTHFVTWNCCWSTLGWPHLQSPGSQCSQGVVYNQSLVWNGLNTPAPLLLDTKIQKHVFYIGSEISPKGLNSNCGQEHGSGYYTIPRAVFLSLSHFPTPFLVFLPLSKYT